MITCANVSNYRKLVALLNHQRKPYMTIDQLKTDLIDGRIFMWEEEGQILGFITLTYALEYEMFYLKRLLVSKRHRREGVAEKLVEAMIEYAESQYSPLACTPFRDNQPMIGLLEKLGFKFRYDFLDNYLLYTKGEY